MAKYIENEVAYYYDSHPTEEDLMGEAPIHRELIHYLADVLKWLFREQVCTVYENINVFQTSEEDEYPIAPDIAVIKGVTYPEIISWRAGIHGPALTWFSRLHLTKPGAMICERNQENTRRWG